MDSSTMWQKLAWLAIAFIFFGLLAQRVWRSMALDRVDHVPMPTSSGSATEQRQLYLVPGGSYTRADIEANGNTTPLVKFRGFQARHDANPRPGDRICPITRTKANPDCTWVVGGATYEFCCPPCVEEFVALAKESPVDVREPEDYIKE